MRKIKMSVRALMLTGGVALLAGAARAETATALPAVTVNGWTTRLANADVNGDGIVKVLALGHSYVDDVSSYFADAVAQMRALGDKTKFVYCNSFYPGCKVSEYVSFLNSDSSAVTMRAFYTDDVPAAERPKRADGTEFPSRTGAWGDYYAGKMSDHLKACDDWDLIVINEGVHAIPNPSAISSYKALIREKLKAWGCTTEPLIGWYMTWAWGPLATTSTCNLSMYYQNSSDVHYSKIVAGVESCKSQFDFVIPVGTALQNLAALEPHNTANAPDYKGTSSRFQRDGTCHLDFICGRWAATLVYLSTLGFDVSGTHFPNEKKYENEGATFVMRPVQDVMCHLCANAAIAKPAAVTDLPWASTDYEFACACGASHDYGATKTVAKTCTADGYTTKTCAACGYEHRTAWVPMSHEDTAVVTAPDCTHAGYTTHKCADCGQTYETDRVRALGHDYAAATNKAECSVTYTCRRAGCGKTYTKVYNHLVKNWTVTKAPTYTEKGERRGTCEICGATVTEEIDVLNDFAFHWDYSNPDDAAATLTRIKTFCTTKDAGNQFEYVPDEGVLRFWAGMDPFISWESAWFNGTHKSITRGFEILTPEGKKPRSFTLKGGTGKFLQPIGSMSRSYTDPGVIFAKDDGGYWSYQICCKCDSTLLYYFCYTGYSSNSAQWAPGGNGTSYPILDVDGEKVDFGNVQQNNNRNQLNFLAENGFLSGEKLTEQTVGYITYQYDVSVADDGKITVQGSLHYDRDGVTWTAKGAARVFDPATDFNKVGNNSHDPKGLVPVFGLHHKPYAEPAGELKSANDKGYNTTDVTSIDAVYE